jgi:cobaltochelatase CobS
MSDTTDKSFEPSAKTVLTAPDTTVDVRETFGIDIDWQVPAFSKPDARSGRQLRVRTRYDHGDPRRVRA